MPELSSQSLAFLARRRVGFSAVKRVGVYAGDVIDDVGASLAESSLNQSESYFFDNEDDDENDDGSLLLLFFLLIFPSS